jgi:uncharacterized protein (TIGR03086 family)
VTTQPLEDAVGATRRVLTAIQPDQLANATPCASWTVSDIINHVVGGHRYFAAAVRGEEPSESETDFASGDYVAAYDEATAASVAAFGEPGAMDRTVKMPFGEIPASMFIGIATGDTFTHGWDLARATGQSTDLDPALADDIYARVSPLLGDALRGPDGESPFGPRQEAPDGANPADRLAAFMGRLP